MSNNESFIDEVTEELRRDQLFGYVRKYGWIAALVVLGLVGAAGYSEYKASQDRADAQETGDAIFAALEFNEPAERLDALEQLEPNVIVQMLTAAAALESEDTQAAIAAYDALAANDAARGIYRQVAMFKSALLKSADLAPDARIEAFSAFDVIGNPLRLLALENIAVAQAEAGDTDGALVSLEKIVNDATASDSVRTRAEALMTALGGVENE